MIEKVSGETYYDYVREHIFKPAGMLDTDNYHLHDDVPNLALGYIPVDKNGQAITHGSPNAAESPVKRMTNSDFMHRGASAGNGYSTVEDLFRFARALQGYQLLSRESTERMMAGQVDMDRPGYRYGFGMIESRVNGVRIVGHSGGGPGISSKLDMYPDLGYTVVVLSNYDNGARAPIEWLERRLMGGPLR